VEVVDEEFLSFERNGGAGAVPRPRAEVRGTVRSQVGPKADEDSAALPTLLSRLWSFISGFTN